MKTSHIFSLILCALISICGGNGAYADDTEIFFGSTANQAGIAPKILIIVDVPFNNYKSSSSSSAASSSSSAASSSSSSASSTSLTDTCVTDSTYNKTCTYASYFSLLASPPQACLDGNIYLSSTTTNIAPSISSCTPPSLLNITIIGYLSTDNFTCKSAINSINLTGVLGSATYINSYITTSNKYKWTSSFTSIESTSFLECKEDTDLTSVHGQTDTSAKWPIYTTGVDSAAALWNTRCKNNDEPCDSSSNKAQNYWEDSSSPRSGKQLTAFNANYLNWRILKTNTSSSSSSLSSSASGGKTDSVTALVTLLESGLTNRRVSYGLMTENDRQKNEPGGKVVEPVALFTTTKQTALINTLKTLETTGDTNLSETLFEAFQYLSARDFSFTNRNRDAKNQSVFYGNPADFVSSTNLGSVVSSRKSNVSTSTDYNKYISPLSSLSDCFSNNHIIYLTNHLAGNNTTDAADEIISATNTDPTSSIATACKNPTNSNSSDAGCLSLLTQYMAQNNIRNGYASKVKTHIVAFGPAITSQSGEAALREAARLGEGQYVESADTGELYAAINNIISRAVADTDATFVSPSVAVNSFNKTQILEDIYVAMFEPSNDTHWDGNLKKFKLREAAQVSCGSSSSSSSNQLTIIDAKTPSVSAIDPCNGFFKTSAEDYWQLSTDTNKDITTKGGAANILPIPSERKIYTNVSANSDLTNSANSFDINNNAVKTSLAVPNGTQLDTLTCSNSTDCAKILINWTRGYSDDLDKNSPTGHRKSMGDPIHSQPSVVIYGGTNVSNPNLNDALVFVATNDGFLHAIDVVSGIEQWSFIPNEVLPDLKNIYVNDYALNKHYSLDGDIRVLRYDSNNNGLIEPPSPNNDRVILYFSQGRGGPNYYAIDVTNKGIPKFLWRFTDNRIEQSWSTPTLARVKVGNGTSQNSQQLVLIFGGGFDKDEEYQGITGYRASDDKGNAIYMVDAINGNLLWSASNSGANFNSDDMDHAIPSNITVLDTDGNGYSDRMYVGDLAGQLWRFDITNGNTASDLVAGGVIASLGTSTAGNTTDNRTFYNAPDVARIAVSGSDNYYNIAIGSGDRSLPKSNTTTQDRFYSIRDYKIAAMTQVDFNKLSDDVSTNGTLITDADLTSVTGTALPSNISTNGWKLELPTGEKSLAQSITLNSTTLFTTYAPGVTNPNACTITTGTSRSYAISATKGFKTNTNLFETFNTTGLPTQISVVSAKSIVRTDGSTPSSSSSSSSSSSNSTTTINTGTCLSGVNILGNCVEFGTKIKTVWRDLGSQ